MTETIRVPAVVVYHDPERHSPSHVTVLVRALDFIVARIFNRDEAQRNHIIPRDVTISKLRLPGKSAGNLSVSPANIGEQHRHRAAE